MSCADRNRAGTSRRRSARKLVRQFGWARVYEGGLKVYTTLDLDMQRAAEAEVDRAVAEIEKRKARMRNGAGPRTTNRSRPRWWRSIRAPARCARWSAAAASTTAISTV